MLDLCRLIFGMVMDLLRSRVALEAEVLVLRQQINVLRRTRPGVDMVTGFAESKRSRRAELDRPTASPGWARAMRHCRVTRSYPTSLSAQRNSLIKLDVAAEG
jgi:hypothetical protein